MPDTLDATGQQAHQAAEHLRSIREQWGDLLAAIEQPPAAEWPPRENREFDLPAPADLDDQLAAIGRMPLVLREHPAPLNLDALDAATDVERALFELADQIAAAVQRPVRRANVATITRSGQPFTRIVEDVSDRADPARWHYQAPTSPGSRAYGLHWAAVWIEGRILGEDTGGLFAHVPARLLDEAAAVTRSARRAVERALGRDGRTTTLGRACPWCGGQLAGRTRSGGEPSVTCSTGYGCSAPVLLDRGRRVWAGPDLVGLYVAMGAAEERAAG
ncbi:hypothetical protein [Streptomyces sp. NBC_01180]|uniref:hypothetical protein n=1 Tax=Streptomyces sp. NBC_01180 TaxID=2903763 RepID=UPI00386D6913|nr:hypothetical protein OG708_17695 [Streptomyces sp. NBC_01180]